jgi:hypothetical protein
MTERILTDTEAIALQGTTDAATGVVFPVVSQNNWAANFYRFSQRVIDALLRANDLRVYPVEGNADAVGIRPGRRRAGSTVINYLGQDPAVDNLTNNDTTYIWIGLNGSISSAVDGTGWPAAPHFKLAEVTMVDGAITAIVDRRAEGLTGLVLESYTDGTRPAAGTAGRVIWNTTTGIPNYDTGSKWVDAAGADV